MLSNLQKTDLYRLHQMNNDFDGGCFSIDIRDVVIETDRDIYQLLDTACKLGDLYPISDSWRKLTFNEGKTMLHWAFQNDLVFDGPRLGKKKANKYSKIVLDHINPDESLAFTNWSDNPWKEESGRSWHGISKNTFDISVVFFDKETLVLTYLVSED